MRLVRTLALASIAGAVIFGCRSLLTTASSPSAPRKPTRGAATQQIARALREGFAQSRVVPAAPTEMGRTIHVRVVDTSRRPLAEASVSIDGGEPVRVAADGTAELLMHDRAEHVLDAFTPSGLLGRRNVFAIELDMREGELWDVEAIQPITLRGRVVDAQGQPVANAHLSVVEMPCEALDRGCGDSPYLTMITPLGNGEHIATDAADARELAKSDALGEFVLPLLHQGSFAVIAKADGFVTAAASASQVTEGDERELVVAVERARRLRVHVVDQFGEPLRSEYVTASQEPESQTTTTDESGYATFANLRVQPTSVAVSPRGGGMVGREVGVNDADEIEFEVTVGAQISVRHCGTGTVALIIIDNEQMRGAVRTRHTEEGCLTLTAAALRAGTYAAYLRTESELVVFPEQTVADAPVRLDAATVRGCDVTIHVEYEVDTFPPRLVIAGADVSRLFSVALPESGTFRVRAARPGTTQLSFQSPLVDTENVWQPLRCGTQVQAVAPPGSEMPTERVANDLPVDPRTEAELEAAFGHVNLCSFQAPSWAYLGENVPVVQTSDPYSFSVPVLSGDVFTRANGTPLTPEEVSQFVAARDCGGPTRFYLRRPRTGQVLAVDTEPVPL